MRPEGGGVATDEGARPPGSPWRWLLVWLGVGILVLWIGTIVAGSAGTPQLSATELLGKVDAHEVTVATIDADGAVKGTLKDGTEFRSQLPTSMLGPETLTRFEVGGVQLTATGPSTSWLSVLLALSPLVMLLVLGWFLLRGRGAGAGSGATGFGRSKATVIKEQRPSVRFSDVAGYDGVKEELGEVVDFLRNPQRYAAVGAVGPSGVLMVGPPGTGKTLFARALAGEADVPFLTVTGSAFVELFVGVGAARVRDLFQQARSMAPAIVFIDEIDAIGQRRAGSSVMSNDEREQTLDQLLAEMDGFTGESGVVVLAATNRPDVLDPALLRPGRFDRRIVIPLPNKIERQAILGVHTRAKPLDPAVDLDIVARSTPGFSGADLANLANEAAIEALRAGRPALLPADFEAARDRFLLGRREGSNVLLPEERRAVAAHEAGHALVAALTPGADPVAKVTILPSGPALGATEQLPRDDRHLYPESWLLASLDVRLAGRVAEQELIGEISSGAADDLARATDLATRMVRELGMSDAMGPVGYAEEDGYLGRGPLSGMNRPYAEETQRLVDVEVARLVREAEARAQVLLRRHRAALTALAGRLLEEETLGGDAVTDVLVGEELGVAVPGVWSRRWAAPSS